MFTQHRALALLTTLCQSPPRCNARAHVWLWLRRAGTQVGEWLRAVVHRQNCGFDCAASTTQQVAVQEHSLVLQSLQQADAAQQGRVGVQLWRVLLCRSRLAGGVGTQVAAGGTDCELR